MRYFWSLVIIFIIFINISSFFIKSLSANIKVLSVYIFIMLNKPKL